MDAASAMSQPMLVRRQDDPNQGKAREAGPTSLSGLVSTLVPVLLYSTIFFLLFLVLRRIMRRQYRARSFLGTLRKEERSPELPNGLFSWIGPFFKIPDTYVLNHHTLDGYLFLRYLKIAVAICFFGCLITWPVLFPINITGGGNPGQLERLNFGDFANKNRYYAHAIVSCVFFAFVIYMITRELIFYINLRQAYLLSPLYANRMSSRTVLFTSVPAPYRDEAKLRQVFGPTVKRVWIATDTKDVQDVVEERDKVAMRLETAETKLVRQANALRLKALKKGGDRRAEEGTHGGPLVADDDGQSGSIASRWLPEKKRPTHRLKPIIGKKVDTINWSRSELQRLLPKVEAAQAVHKAGEAPHVGAVFVEFRTQSAAQDAYQRVIHHQPLHMAPRYIGIRPDEVLWDNLKIQWWQRIVRQIATTAFVVAMIIFWAIPVAAVGAISNVDSLARELTFLRFVLDIPPVIRGVVTGFLPVVLLAILIALVPVVLRLMAKLGGAASKPQVELSVQNSYFAFQVIQVFLVTTITSAASAAVADIVQSPTSATDLLAQNLPKASNFYINYFILQGLTISSGMLLQLVPLIISIIMGIFVQGTPRKIYQRWSRLKGLGWGSVVPVFTNLVVIALTYSCIAPLVLGFATIGLFLIYLAFRYNLLFTSNADIDTRGLIYPRALQQTMTGIYLAEICLIGLFGIQAATGPIIIEVIALILTVLYHVSLSKAVSPLLATLPKTLEAEEHNLQAIESGARPAGDEYGEKVGVVEPLAMGNGVHDGPSSNSGPRVLEAGAAANTRVASPVGKKPNFIAKWLRPDKYCDYRTLRRLVPIGWSDIHYTEEQAHDAYYHPAIASDTPRLWIPRDEAGISRQEVRHTSKVIPITDEGAYLNEKNKIITNPEERPPIHEPTVWY